MYKVDNDSCQSALNRLMKTKLDLQVAKVIKIFALFANVNNRGLVRFVSLTESREMRENSRALSVHIPCVYTGCWNRG